MGKGFGRRGLPLKKFPFLFMGGYAYPVPNRMLGIQKELKNCKSPGKRRGWSKEAGRNPPNEILFAFASLSVEGPTLKTEAQQ